jgi:hypothetical protein
VGTGQDEVEELYVDIGRWKPRSLDRITVTIIIMIIKGVGEAWDQADGNSFYFAAPKNSSEYSAMAFRRV